MAASSEVRERWQELIEEYATSGETVAGWCQFNNIAVHSFYYWKKRLRRRDLICELQNAAHPGVQWLSMDTSPHPNTDHPNTNQLGTNQPSTPAASPLTLIVGSIAVQVQPGFDPRLLNDVLTVVLRHDVKQRC